MAVAFGFAGCIFGQQFQAPQQPSLSEELPQEGSEKDETMAYVRVWFMVAEKGDVDLVVRRDGLEPDYLTSRPAPAFYGGYRDVAPGKVRFVVQPHGAAHPGSPLPPPLAESEETLVKGRFFTMLVTSAGERYRIEVLDDSPKSTTDQPAPVPELSAYNFVKEGTVKIKARESGAEANLAYGGRVRFTELPGTKLSLNVEWMDPSGRRHVRETDAELGNGSSFSLLVLRDLYGRFSPRLITNGRLD